MKILYMQTKDQTSSHLLSKHLSIKSEIGDPVGKDVDEAVKSCLSKQIPGGSTAYVLRRVILNKLTLCSTINCNTLCWVLQKSNISELSYQEVMNIEFILIECKIICMHVYTTQIYWIVKIYHNTFFILNSKSQYDSHTWKYQFIPIKHW